MKIKNNKKDDRVRNVMPNKMFLCEIAKFAIFNHFEPV